MFNRLSEWIYPSEPKEEIQRVLNDVFFALKDASTDMLRKLYRNCQIIFPPKFYQIDADLIRDKLDNVCKYQLISRQGMERQRGDRSNLT